jgi:hypothetical protein
MGAGWAVMSSDFPSFSDNSDDVDANARWEAYLALMRRTGVVLPGLGAEEAEENDGFATAEDAAARAFAAPAEPRSFADLEAPPDTPRAPEPAEILAAPVTGATHNKAGGEQARLADWAGWIRRGAPLAAVLALSAGIGIAAQSGLHLTARKAEAAPRPIAAAPAAGLVDPIRLTSVAAAPCVGVDPSPATLAALGPAPVTAEPALLRLNGAPPTTRPVRIALTAAAPLAPRAMKHAASWSRHCVHCHPTRISHRRERPRSCSIHTTGSGRRSNTCRSAIFHPIHFPGLPGRW